MAGQRKRRKREALMSRSLISGRPRLLHSCRHEANTSLSSRGKTLSRDRQRWAWGSGRAQDSTGPDLVSLTSPCQQWHELRALQKTRQDTCWAGRLLNRPETTPHRVGSRFTQACAEAGRTDSMPGSAARVTRHYLASSPGETYLSTLTGFRV